MAEPSFNEFDPTVIPWQYDVINLIFEEWDYSKGLLEILLTGGIGGAKSIILAHVATRIAYQYHGARVLIGRRVLADLKKTLYPTIRAHMEGTFIEKYHYRARDSDATVVFRPGSERRSGKIFGHSWGDGNYKDVRSLSLTAAIIEELTENDEHDREAIMEIKKRIGRTSHIPISLLLCATNPDSPEHWAYKYFIEGAKDHENRKVFRSHPRHNPFLKEGYLLGLLRDMPEREAQRMINGEWVPLDGLGIYFEYRSDDQYFRATRYEPRPDLPIWWCWDFNIGFGKPMSCCFFQYHPNTDTYHVFAEVVADTLNTRQVCEEAWDRGLINPNFLYCIGGDRNGHNKDTRNTLSDYDIIHKFLHEKGVRFEKCVPASNPPVRDRQNHVNTYCKNGLGHVRLFLYQGVETTDEGLRLTKLKDGASYIEDDSKRYQHVTTALGYGMHFEWRKRRSKSGVILQ